MSSLKEFRQEGVVLQQWDISCAAAALATILNYQHADPVTERQIALSLIQRPEYIADPELVRRRQGYSLLDLFVDARGYLGTGFGRLRLADLEARAGELSWLAQLYQYLMEVWIHEALATFNRRRDTLEGRLDLRLGLPFESQLEFGLPYRHVLETDAVRIGLQPHDATDRSGGGLGDARLAFAKTLLREDGWRPDLVGRFAWHAPTAQRRAGGSHWAAAFTALRASWWRSSGSTHWCS